MLLARHAATNRGSSTRPRSVNPSLLQHLVTAPQRLQACGAPLSGQATQRQARPLIPTRCFSTRHSLREAGGGKVEALPFELDPYTARILAQTLAMAKSKDSRLQKRYLYPLAMIVRHFFGVGPADRMEAAKANVDKMQAVYLPYWIVDGNLSIQAKNSSGEATKLNLVSINSRMPGFDFAPLRSLPLAPPQLDEAVQYQRFTKALVDGPAATLKAFMRKRHSVQVDGQSALPKQAEVLPFVTSPLSLSALFRDASAYASEVKLPNFASSPLKHGYTLVAMDETTAAQKIRLQGETLDVDMLAAYAVMLPFYVVKFKPVVDEEGQRKPPMVVVQSAWFDEYGTPACYMGGDVADDQVNDIIKGSSLRSPWSVQGGSSLMASLRMPYFDASFQQAPRRARSGSRRSFEDPSQQFKGIRLSLMRMQLSSMLQTWLEKGDWTAWKVKEREAAGRRIAKRVEQSADATKGLGEHLDWHDVRVQRFSEQSEENRQYLEAVDAVNRKQLVETLGLDFESPTSRNVKPHPSLSITLGPLVLEMGSLKNDASSADDSSSEDKTLEELEEERREAKPEWLKASRLGGGSRQLSKAVTSSASGAEGLSL